MPCPRPSDSETVCGLQQSVRCMLRFETVHYTTTQEYTLLSFQFSFPTHLSSHTSFLGMPLTQQACSCLRAFALAFPLAQNTFPSRRLLQTFALLRPLVKYKVSAQMSLLPSLSERPSKATLSKTELHSIHLACSLFLHRIYHYVTLNISSFVYCHSYP